MNLAAIRWLLPRVRLTDQNLYKEIYTSEYFVTLSGPPSGLCYKILNVSVSTQPICVYA